MCVCLYMWGHSKVPTINTYAGAIQTHIHTYTHTHACRLGTQTQIDVAIMMSKEEEERDQRRRAAMAKWNPVVISYVTPITPL
jgi:hypothetical protein